MKEKEARGINCVLGMSLEKEEVCHGMLESKITTHPPNKEPNSQRKR